MGDIYKCAVNQRNSECLKMNLQGKLQHSAVANVSFFANEAMIDIIIN